jgi:hypothetical protein
MEQWQTTLVASFVGAAVGSIFAIIGMVVNSWLTLSRERRQLAWKTEVNRIVELEERAGALVEIATSHRGIEEIIERTRDHYNSWSSMHVDLNATKGSCRHSEICTTDWVAYLIRSRIMKTGEKSR